MLAASLLGSNDVVIPKIALFMSPGVLLSLIGSGFIFISYFLFRDYRNKSPLHDTICCMAICDFGFMLVWYFPFFFNSNISCTIQAPLTEFFSEGTIHWTWIYALRLYLTNMEDKKDSGDVSMDGFKKRIKLDNKIVWHILGWGIPFCISAAGVIFHLYGKAGAWCWIADTHPLEQIFMGDGLVVVMFAIELVVFVSLLYHLRTPQGGDALLAAKRKVMLRFALYLAIPPVCWSFGLANRILGLKGQHVVWVQYMQAIFTTWQGFFNALVYGWDPELRALWITLIYKKFGKKRPETAPLIVNEEHLKVNVSQLYNDEENLKDFVGRSPGL